MKLSAILTLLIFNVLLCPVLAISSPVAEYYSVKASVYSGNPLRWTSIYYPGSRNVFEARAQCVKTVEALKKEFGNPVKKSDLPPIYSVGLGPDCYVGVNILGKDIWAPSRQILDIYGNTISPSEATNGPYLPAKGYGAALTSCDFIDSFASAAFSDRFMDRLKSGKIIGPELIRANMYELAYLIFDAETAFRFYDIDESIWAGMLKTLETSLADSFEIDHRQFSHRILTSLSALAIKINTTYNSTPKLAAVGGCGGGILVLISGLPSNSTLDIILRGEYFTCGDLYSKKCLMYLKTNIKNGEIRRLSGTYLYRIVTNRRQGEFKEIHIGGEYLKNYNGGPIEINFQ